MSQALIYAWVAKKPFYHTAVDDLESFVWVLLWSVIDILQLRKALENKDERCYLQTMRSDKIKELLSRGTFLDMIEASALAGSASEGFKPFIELLVAWLKLAKAAFKAMVPCAPSLAEKAINVAEAIQEGSRTTDTIEFYKGFYKDYVTIGFEHVKKLPETWDYIPTEDINGSGTKVVGESIRKQVK